MTLAILYVHSNMIHINPMLNLFGYHLYEITLVEGETYALLTGRRISRKSRCRWSLSARGFFWRKGDESGESTAAY